MHAVLGPKKYTMQSNHIKINSLLMSRNRIPCLPYYFYCVGGRSFFHECMNMFIFTFTYISIVSFLKPKFYEHHSN